MESVYKSLILIEAKDLINTIKDNKEFRILVKELEYFVNLQEKNITFLFYRSSSQSAHHCISSLFSSKYLNFDSLL